MSDELEQTAYSEDNAELCPIDELHILVTDEDINGENILAMSDFFSGYISHLATEVRSNGTIEVMSEIPIANIGILADVLNQADILMQGTTQLIPDFDSLPSDIKKGLKSGEFSIGESRMVDGNLRSVIVDKTGTRVKDVTLKRVSVNSGMFETTRSIGTQLQMRQIYSKLDAIHQMQTFQIARDRDRDFKVPFLNARYHILKAQKCTTKAERDSHLETAAEYLLKAESNLYTDITTSTNMLVKHTRIPIFRKKQAINDGIGYISEDLQTVTKLVGLRMQLLDHLGDTDGARIEMDRYHRAMSDFFAQPLPNRGYSAAALIHMNYPYTAENTNCWYQLSTEMTSQLRAIEAQSENQVFLVSLEDDDNGEE